MDIHSSRARREQDRRSRMRRRRGAALGLPVIVAVVVAVLAATGGGGGHRAGTGAPQRSHVAAAAPARHAVALGPAVRWSHVPILMYHVINPPPPGAKFPGLYVPAGEFAAQMHALAAAGWRAVTLDQLRDNWLHGTRLPRGRPVVVTFDNGYQSQYSNALPVLRSLDWPGDLNIQLTGLPPSQGGLASWQVRALLHGGWELDTQGISHADLIRLGPTQLRAQTAGARQTLRARYGVTVNWFCYPSGHYDPTVIAAVRAAGYVGSTTVVPGLAGPADDPYRLPRIRVLGGTSPSALLRLIAAVAGDPAAPTSYG